jgi:peptidoglycan lytic transglycosylase G
MADSSERTPEEREAARLERARRREMAGGDSAAAGLGDRPPAWDGDDAAAYEEMPEDGDGDAHEVASGTRRVGWRERTAAASATPAAARSDPPQRRPGGEPRGRRSLLIRVAAVLALLLAAAVIWFCIELFQPFHGSGHGSVTVTVPARVGAHQVGNLLERDGVVASGLFFYLRAALAGDRGKLRAGTYHLKLDMSYGQALKALTTPPPAAKVTNVTIIPGDTRAQLNALLRSQGIGGSYLAATRRSPLLDPSAYGAPARTASLEGFLYPDTYQLREPISLAALVADQLTAFKRAFASVNLGYARGRHLTAYDVLIIASIVEREAATARDRPLVASVIYNRLRDGIRLGMDSTTRYEFNDYTKPLTASQLASPSPYNTRLNRGLPPTPISNPGLASIQAAAHPTHTDYLYFVVKPCGNGASVFSSSYSQFLADSARYQRARRARGGRSPTKC